MKLYALHDKKAKSFTHFTVQKNDTVAARGFAEAVLEANSPLAWYPEDFELASLCDVSQDYEFSPEDEIVVALQEFRVVITAEQVIAAQPKAQQQELSLVDPRKEA